MSQGEFPVPAAAQALAVVGIDLIGAQVYQLVLRNPGSDAGFVAERLGRHPAVIGDELARLADVGLVQLSEGTARAERPQVALGRLITRQGEQLVAAEAALAEARLNVAHFEVEYEAAMSEGVRAAGVDILDPLEITAAVESLAVSTTGDMLFLRPTQWQLSAERNADEGVIRALERGRVSRAIYPNEVADRDVPSIRRRREAGERIRLLPHVPCRMVVFGDQAVVLPQEWGGGHDRAVLIREPGVVSVCTEWFELLWAQADTPADHVAHTPDRFQSELIGLLARGVKDERIARALGVSLRTVRRRVAELLVELGVETRFQAGAEAARRGWL